MIQVFKISPEGRRRSMRNGWLQAWAMVLLCVALVAFKYFYLGHGNTLLGFGKDCLLPLGLSVFFGCSVVYRVHRRAKGYLLQLGEDFVSGQEPDESEVRIPFHALTKVRKQWDCLRIDSKANFLTIPFELDHFKEVEARLRAVAAHK